MPRIMMEFNSFSFSEDFVTYGLPFLLLLLVLLFLGIVALYHRETILIYLYSHPKLRRLVFISEYSVKEYDVFISYSEADAEYVEGVLVQGLENGDQELK